MRLRPFEIGDSIAVQRLAGDRRVALAAAAIPHPYPDGEAERWIATHAPAFVARREITFAVVLADEDALVGAIALIEWSERHARGELGCRDESLDPVVPHGSGSFPAAGAYCATPRIA